MRKEQYLYQRMNFFHIGAYIYPTQSMKTCNHKRKTLSFTTYSLGASK